MNQVELAGYSLQLARAMGKYEGFTNFLVESPDNTMTKEQIVARMAEILQEFKEATTKPSRERAIEREREIEMEEFRSHLGRF
jgi:hypothetical protein